MKKTNKEKHFLNALLILVAIFAIYLIFALISFNSSDPSWLQTALSNEPINNFGGTIGAWIADMMLFVFGFTAYAISPIMLVLCLAVYRDSRRDYIDYFVLSRRLIIVLVIVLASCGLAELNIDELYHFSSGGIIGIFLISEILNQCSGTCATLILLCVWATGIVLCTTWSWLIIAEKIGGAILDIARSVTKCIHGETYYASNDGRCHAYNKLEPTMQGVGVVIDNVLLPGLNTRINQKESIDHFHIKISAINKLPPLYPYEILEKIAVPNVPYKILSCDHPDKANCDINCMQLDVKNRHINSYFNSGSTSKNKSGNLLFDAAKSPFNLMRPQLKKGTRNHCPPVSKAKICCTSLVKHSVVKEASNSIRNIMHNQPSPYGIKPSVATSVEQTIKDKHSQSAAGAREHDVTKSKYDDNTKQKTHKNSKQIKSATQQSEINCLAYPFYASSNRLFKKTNTPMPTLALLAEVQQKAGPPDILALKEKALLIEKSLVNYRITAKVVNIIAGPVITRFELELAPGVKVARISSLSRDLARSLSTSVVRVVEVILGKPYVGLDLPNVKRQTVYLREVLDCPAFNDNRSSLTIVLGKDISGEPVVADLDKMPHLLLAGTTGSGKSMGVNAIILSILYKSTPKEVRFIMIDPKMLELSAYQGMPHLLIDVLTDMKDAANALRWCVSEMERRYRLMSVLGVRNLASYNNHIDQAENVGHPIQGPFWKSEDKINIGSTVLEKEPYIVVIVDEFADLIMTAGKKVEELIARIAQKARAAGIHLVLATQRPSVDVITGLIKANIPTRIAFTVSSKIDSRTILEQGGAELLLGMGDMLYRAPNTSVPIRVHGAFVHDQDVRAVARYWRETGQLQYKKEILNIGQKSKEKESDIKDYDDLDPLFSRAVTLVMDKRRVSISAIQRQCRIGYNRAARIIEQMKAQGIISAARDVIEIDRHEPHPIGKIDSC